MLVQNPVHIAMSLRRIADGIYRAANRISPEDDENEDAARGADFHEDLNSLDVAITELLELQEEFIPIYYALGMLRERTRAAIFKPKPKKKKIKVKQKKSKYIADFD